MIRRLAAALAVTVALVGCAALPADAATGHKHKHHLHLTWPHHVGGSLPVSEWPCDWNCS